jgi:ferritin-like metal-binding protein YciE
MSYKSENMETRFEEFVEQTNQKISDLEAMIRSLQNELNTTKKETVKINVVNNDIKSSLGATIKTVGDIVRKNGYRK